MARTIIKGGYILSMDKKVGDLPKGDIVIEGALAPAVMRQP